MATFVPPEPEPIYRRRISAKVSVRQVVPADHRQYEIACTEDIDRLFMWLSMRGFYSLSLQVASDDVAHYTTTGLEFRTGDWLVCEYGEVTAYDEESFAQEFQRVEK